MASGTKRPSGVPHFCRVARRAQAETALPLTNFKGKPPHGYTNLRFSQSTTEKGSNGYKESFLLREAGIGQEDSGWGSYGSNDLTRRCMRSCSIHLAQRE